MWLNRRPPADQANGMVTSLFWQRVLHSPLLTGSLAGLPEFHIEFLCAPGLSWRLHFFAIGRSDASASCG